MGRDDERSGKIGGAEAVARFKQYEYKAVSLLIGCSLRYWSCQMSV